MPVNSRVSRAYDGWPPAEEEWVEVPAGGMGGGPACSISHCLIGPTDNPSSIETTRCHIVLAFQPVLRLALPTAWPHGLSRHHTHQLGLPSPQAKAPRFVSRHPWHMPSPRSSNAKNSCVQMRNCRNKEISNHGFVVFLFFFVLCYSFTNP